MDSEHSEVLAVLGALNRRLEMASDDDEYFSPQGLGNALFGLQTMTNAYRKTSTTASDKETKRGVIDETLFLLGQRLCAFNAADPQTQQRTMSPHEISNALFGERI